MGPLRSRSVLGAVAALATAGMVLTGCSTGAEPADTEATADTATDTSQSAGSWQIDSNYQVDYSVVDSALRIQFQLSNNNRGWMGVAFNDFEFPADTVIAWYDQTSGSATCWDAYNPGIPTLPSFPAPVQDTDPVLRIQGGSPLNNKDNVRLVSADVSDGVTTIVCERDLITGDIFDRQFRTGGTFAVWGAYNSELGFINENGAAQPTWTKDATDTWRL